MNKNNENEEQNAYEVVGVSSDATDAEIKKGFRQRSLKTHPDRVCRLPWLSWWLAYLLFSAPRILISKMQVFLYPPF